MSIASTINQILACIFLLSACSSINMADISENKQTEKSVLNHKLSKAAQKHSQDMYRHQFLEHTSSNGDTLVERMKGVKYIWSAVGENIAHNQSSIGQVLDDWLGSPGHCSNIMSADYTQTGVANIHKYWTQVYAAPK